MDTRRRMSVEQAEVIAEELLEHAPRFRDTMIARLAEAWRLRDRSIVDYGWEPDPFANPASPRWPIYNSMFDK